MNGFKSYGTRVLRTGDVILLSKTVDNEDESMLYAEDSKGLEKLAKLVNFTNNLLDPVRNPALQVLYEDEVMAIVLKPAGVHSLQWLGPMKRNLFCLDDSIGIILTAPLSDALARPLPCHRLDMRVSGRDSIRIFASV